MKCPLGLAPELLSRNGLMIHKIVIFFLAVAVFTTACQPRQQDLTGRDPLEEGYRKIDRGEYDLAIRDLEYLTTKDARPQVQEALASAYAARAGILVKSYWGAVVGFEAPLLSLKTSRKKSATTQMARIIAQLEGRRDIKGRDEFSRLAEVLITASEWKERIEKLPTIPEKRRGDLRTALSVLKNHKTQGGRLYRALLGLILLKSEIDDGFEGWGRIEVALIERAGPSPDKWAANLICDTVDFDGFMDWTLHLVRILQSAALDVAEAYPSKKKDLNRAVTESEQVANRYLDSEGSSCR